MTTDLSTLTNAADKCDEMAGEFKKLEADYKRDVSNISLGLSWQGLAASAASSRFKVTLSEYQAAQKEAKAIASLLRDAYQQFTELRGKLKAVHDDAIKAGMKVSEQGVVEFDFDKMDEGSRTAYHHDRDYQDSVRTAVGEWNQAIKAAVQDINDADDGVKIALEAAVIDGDATDGTWNGFNRHAKSDVEEYEADHAAAIAMEINNGNKVSAADMAELQRTFRDNADDTKFTQTFLNGLGAQNTLKFTNRLNDLAYFDDKDHKKDYLGLQKGLATTLATATKDPDSTFYKDFRADLKKAGVQQFDLDAAGDKIAVGIGHGQQARGYQSLVTLMQHGDGYSGQFLKDMADDIRHAEDKGQGGDPDIWDLSGDFSGSKDGWFANDPLDGVLGIMAEDPKTATSYLDPGADSKNDNLEYLLKERDWDLVNTTKDQAKVEGIGPDTFDKDVRAGFGAVLESAATGYVPGSDHELGGHSIAQARVMHDTINVLNSSGQAEKLPENLTQPMANLMTDYTPDLHQILGLDNNTYNTSDKAWTDEDGQTHMSVPKDQLVKLMRGVADDPEAFGQVYRAEKQYSLDTFAGMPDSTTNDTTKARIQEASAAMGAYDGVRGDIAFDKRFKDTQWTNDFNNAVTSAPGAALNFVPDKYGVTGDIGNRILGFASYEATKDRIAEINAAATEENYKTFTSGQKVVDGMVTSWAESNGHDKESDFAKVLVGDGQLKHKQGRDEALLALRTDM
ncbi:hypothetical protein ABZ532_05030 [Streptomyces sp. NPDC019396]|uniref:hypothetical protein n=1 Tax=Streptomyces sp. NPDC019396 TaxID=3154687 RepID=UPI0033F13730